MGLTKTLICLLIIGFPLRGVFAQLDSLLNIRQAERDLLWVDHVTKASWNLMYSNPRKVMAALNSAEIFAKSKSLTQKLPRLYLNVGIAYDVLDIPDSALLLYNQAKDMAIQLNDSSIYASALNNIGLVYWNLDYLDSALYYYIRSESIFEAVANLHGLTSTMNNIGLIYLDQGRSEKARDYFRKVLTKGKAQNSKYFESVAYQNIGLTFDSDGRNDHQPNLDSAIFYVRRAIPIQKEIENDFGLAKSYHSLTSLYSASKNYEAAIENCLAAIETNKGIENFHALASNYYQLAGIYKDIEKIAKAKMAIDLARDYTPNFDDDDLKQKIYEAQVDISLLITNPELFRTFRRAIGIKDSLYKVSLHGGIIKMEEAYEAEKREKQIVIKDAEIKLNKARIKTQLIVGIISGIFLLAIIAWLISRSRYRRKINALEYNSKIHAEKSRISKDLHDNVGAQLTSIATRIAMAGSQSHSDEKIAMQLQQVGDEAKETIHLLRDTIWAMNQESFTIDAFANRVQSYGAMQLRDIAEVSIEKTEQTFPELNSHTALNLFRIIQEAIQNTIKHSRANKMIFSFSRQNGKSLLKISDNGKGDSIESENGHAHYGLENMRSRAADINAQIEFSYPKNRGFTIKISW